jgi:CDGSH-type Zn-finger protein
VHKKIAHTIDEHDEPILPYKSIKVEFEKEEEVWFCQCKQTKTPPYCDGSHNKLK